MSKLTREPCATCGTDTLHKVGLCLTCRTVAPRQSDYYRKVKKIRRRKFAQLKAYFGASFDGGAAAAAVARETNLSELAATRKQNAQRSQRLSIGAPEYRTSAFGRGRERTKA